MSEIFLEYGRYRGSVRVNSERGCFSGRVLFVEDPIEYHGASLEELRLAFKAAVVGYQETCKRSGKELVSAFGGVFTVRLDACLHWRAAQRATAEGVSLERFICSAITAVLARHEDETFRLFPEDFV